MRVLSNNKQGVQIRILSEKKPKKLVQIAKKLNKFLSHKKKIFKNVSLSHARKRVWTPEPAEMPLSNCNLYECAVRVHECD